MNASAVHFVSVHQRGLGDPALPDSLLKRVAVIFLNARVTHSLLLCFLRCLFLGCTHIIAGVLQCYFDVQFFINSAKTDLCDWTQGLFFSRVMSHIQSSDGFFYEVNRKCFFFYFNG